MLIFLRRLTRLLAPARPGQAESDLAALPGFSDIFLYVCKCFLVLVFRDGTVSISVPISLRKDVGGKHAMGRARDVRP